VVQKRGAFFSYGDLRIGQGRENAKDYLRQNPDLMGEIDTVIRQKALSGEIALPLEIGGGGEDGGGETSDEA
jgi:recombination protein RecA